jgi:hypothetical protein
MGVMLDALTELGDLSRDLQKRDMTLPRAHKVIDRQIRVLESMANSPGPYVQQATAAVASNEFHGIKLASNTKVDIQVHPGQFFRSLVANLRQRLFTTTASHVGMSDKLRTAAAASYSTLLSAM